MAQHLLVTGGAGFIGSHLVEALLKRGDRVTALDDLSTGRLANLDAFGGNDRFRFVQGSILDELMVDEQVARADVVVHLAAVVGVKLIVSQTLRSFITNIRGTEIVLDAAHRYRKPVLLASSSEVYGKNGCDGLTETSDRILGAPSVSRWSYATSKAADEVLAFAYHRERGLSVKIGRFFNTVGPRQSPAYGMVIPTLVDQALDGVPLTVHGDGQQRRSFCHVADVVDAVIRLLNEPAANGQAYNIGVRREISIVDLANEVVRRTGSASEVHLTSYEDAFGPGFEDMRRRMPDVTKLTALTGWAATRSLADILEETIAHARADHLASAIVVAQAVR
jgi:UDP-glucose 4-epimerase